MMKKEYPSLVWLVFLMLLLMVVLSFFMMVKTKDLNVNQIKKEVVKK